jgi:peptide/nickel transport system permease protein
MAAISSTPSIARLTTRPGSPNYLIRAWWTITGFFAFGTGAIGLLLLSRGDTPAGALALLSAVMLCVLAVYMATQRLLALPTLRRVHQGLLLVSLLLFGRWALETIGLINSNPKIAAASSFGDALALIRQVPINPLTLADAILLFGVNVGMLWLLGTIQRKDTEQARDPNHLSGPEQFLIRFFKSPSARIGSVIVLALLATVYVMPRVDPYDQARVLADGVLAERLNPPDCVIGWVRLRQGIDTWDESKGAEPASLLQMPCNHVFGTDKNGRDLARRVLHGIGVSLAVSLISVSISALIGITIGMIAGYASGRLDTLLMRLMDILLAFPSLLLAIAIVAMRGPGLENTMLAIGIVGIPAYARIARSMAIGLRDQEFITAATSLGVKRTSILWGHILPNSLAPLIVQGTLGLGTAVIEAAALGFLGLGQQPPFPELGKMMAESREVLTSGMWWVMVFPGLSVMLIVLGFNLLGDALRDTLDPRLRGM